MPRPADVFSSSEGGSFPLIGSRAKALRLTRGLSIRGLAKAAGVDKNTILRLERGEPVSARVLSGVCRSLETALPSLTLGAPESTSVQVFRADETKWVSMIQRPEARGHLPTYTSVPESAERERYGRLGFTTGFLMTHACTITNGQMNAAIYEVHHPWIDPIHHPGEEFVYCLRGEVRVTVGEETYVLGEGDSMGFDSSLLHNFERVSRPPAPAPQVLSVWIEGGTDAKPSRP